MERMKGFFFICYNFIFYLKKLTQKTEEKQVLENMGKYREFTKANK